jgi:hypothetical protein
MIFSRTTECPSCKEKNPKDANHCGKCGQRLPGGMLPCGKCGTENRGDANFCGNCRAPLAHDAAPLLNRNRWMRGEDDYAIRIEVDDLDGLLRRGLVVEPGTNALLIKGGATQGTLPPGNYTMDTLPSRVLDWLSGGMVGPVTALLVEVVPTEFVFEIKRLFTKDPIKLDLTVRLVAEVDSPGKFLTNMLRGRERYTREDLRSYLSPEVEQTAAAWLRRHSLQDLAENPALRDDFEMELEEALKKTFAQSGLRFKNIRTMELGLEHIDQVSGTRSRYILEAAEAEAKAEGMGTLGEAQKELDIQKLADDTRKVELEESRAALYGRMRRATMSNRMDEVRSEDEFKTFLKDMDQRELLDEKERKELLRTWKEEAEDHERARAILHSRAEVEEKFAKEHAAIQAQAEIDQTLLDNEIAQARKRADHEIAQRKNFALAELELEREKDRIAAERARAQLELEELQWRQAHAQEKEELQLAMESLAMMKEIKRLDKEENLRIEREHELASKKAIFEMEMEKRRFESQVQRDKDAHQLAMADKLKGMTAVEIAGLVPEEKGRVLIELERVITAGEASEREKELHDRMMAEASEREKALYERMLADKDTVSKREKDFFEHMLADKDKSGDQRAQDVKEISKHALDRQTETSTSFAAGESKVIVTGSGEPQIIRAGAAGMQASTNTTNMKACPDCARPQEEDTRFCRFCGHEFKGMS